ncbi:MAG: hypothetical protein HUU38_11275 [Anaerolineales bacterium]|nr:hypothetical protein [Anaerolineales bacterium]
MSAFRIVFAVALSNGQILAGGPGGISVYNEEWVLEEQITVQDGLPDNRVFSLFLDEEDGNLWAGTANGLGRFDGEQWITYGFEDGLDDTTINFVSRAGEYIVVGTAYGPEGGGINLFDGERWSHPANFDSAYDDPNRFDNSVWDAVYDDNTGLTWFATENGLGAYDGASFTRYTTEQGLPGNFINGLTLFEDGLLVATTESGAAWYDGENFQVFEPTRGYMINDAVVDSEGFYWFPGGSGIWRYNPATGNWDFFEGGGDFPTYTAYRAVADDDNNIFIGSEGAGLVAFDGTEFYALDRPAGPVATSYWGILEDAEGVLWFLEEYGQHIDTYNIANETWEPEEFEVCCVNPLTFDAEGNLWGGGETGLWIISPNGDATNLTTEQGLPSNQVYHLAFAGEGVTWVATEGGLARLEGFEVVEVLKAAEIGLVSDWTRYVFVAGDGSLWVGREGGLSQLTPEGTWEHFGIGTLFTEGFSFVSYITEHPDGSLWVATLGDGLYQQKDGEWEHYTPGDPGVRLSTPYIYSIHIAPDQSLWFGTEDGVARFDGAQWWAWKLEDGLNHWNVNDILVQADGTVWFATSGGITRWRP